MMSSSVQPDVDESWRAWAACADESPDLFYEPEHEDKAKAICADCPVRKPCLEFAIRAHVATRVEGVWGGMSSVEIMREIRRRRRARRARVGS